MIKSVTPADTDTERQTHRQRERERERERERKREREREREPFSLSHLLRIQLFLPPWFVLFWMLVSLFSCLDVAIFAQ